MTVYRIGTSGWSYEDWGEGVFYPDGLASNERLAYYSARFDTVEVNNTYYRIPRESVVEGWAKGVPDGFALTFKASGTITHRHRLRDCEEVLGVFLGRVRRAGADKIGSVLYQLPAYFKRDDEVLEGFLALLPDDIPAAFEFRSKSWFDDVVFDALKRHNVALCVHDFKDLEVPVATTADVAYFRLHGPDGTEDEYTAAQLAAWAERIAGVAEQVRTTYVYFDNNVDGNAVRNALAIRDMLSG